MAMPIAMRRSVSASAASASIPMPPMLMFVRAASEGDGEGVGIGAEWPDRPSTPPPSPRTPLDEKRLLASPVPPGRTPSVAYTDCMQEEWTEEDDRVWNQVLSRMGL